jgi:hypothetical protein
MIKNLLFFSLRNRWVVIAVSVVLMGVGYWCFTQLKIEAYPDIADTNVIVIAQYPGRAKYVKLAGHTAYAGVLVALDSLLGYKKRGRKEVSWYKERLGAMDKRVLKHFSSAYDLLHLSISYDGNPETVVAQLGLKRAEEIISWVETRACA